MAQSPRSSGRMLGYRAVQVLGFVRQHLADEGRAPTYAEICVALGINSKGQVSRTVKALEKRGLLSRVGKGRVRRIRL